MKCIDSVKASLMRTDNRQAAAAASPAPVAPAYCISGYSQEDNWETMRLAAYRSLTRAFAMRRYDSEPDLVNRRRPQFAAAQPPRQHRRSWTFPERDVQPWARAVRETRSCPVPPRPANDSFA